jgi:hypothetical protein
MFGNLEPGRSKRLSATGLVLTASGQAMLSGILCAQSSSLIISIYDGIDATGELVVNQVPLTAGVPLPVPRIINKGIYISFVSGSGDITVFYN